MRTQARCTDHDDARQTVRRPEGAPATFSTTSRLGVRLMVPPALLRGTDAGTMTRAQYLSYADHEEARIR